MTTDSDCLTSTLLCPGYEPGDGSADGAQMVDLEWWHPVMGCDSLQIVMDNARSWLASKCRPAITPIPVSEHQPTTEAPYRALCAQMLQVLAECDSADLPDLIKRVSAALVKPEPVEPTDEELEHMRYYGFTTSTGHGEKTDEIGFARAVLARWGRPATTTPQ